MSPPLQEHAGWPALSTVARKNMSTVQAVQRPVNTAGPRRATARCCKWLCSADRHPRQPVSFRCLMHHVRESRSRDDSWNYVQEAGA